jgi:hypothetical protein
MRDRAEYSHHESAQAPFSALRSTGLRPSKTAPQRPATAMAERGRGQRRGRGGRVRRTPRGQSQRSHTLIDQSREEAGIDDEVAKLGVKGSGRFCGDRLISPTGAIVGAKGSPAAPQRLRTSTHMLSFQPKARLFLAILRAGVGDVVAPGTARRAARTSRPSSIFAVLEGALDENRNYAEP